MTLTEEPRTDAGDAGIRRSRPPRVPRPPRAPKPPSRPPRPPKTVVPLTATESLVRAIVAMISALGLLFVLNVVAFSHVQHLVAQQRLGDEFRAQLEAGTAPVSEGTFDDKLLRDGAPVGILEIPRLGLYEIVVEGSSSAETAQGVGHERDSVLPGQSGVSKLLGRSAAFGGPFSGIQSLSPGDAITVRTGQGLQEFQVMGVRYAGDPKPPDLKPGESRLMLMTARGAPYIPTGIAYVDARRVDQGEPRGPRLTVPATLPDADKPMATDTTTLWALVFALQFLIAIEIAAVWAFRRFGAQRTWIVFVPVLLLAGFLVANQVTLLLPNLL
ncbi:sortase [Microbacterium sp. 10M-3C3]|uniref:sortase n=1 Tax=Microbacterium sp. 10M-3C3 TaxID=2483401 RepID=UPI001F0C92A4|nr:sortase [Microbacterium sp. 10M-3C3]